MSDVYDGNGNRIGYLSGGGMDLGGCLSLGAMIFVVMTVWKIAKPFWSAMQAKGVHPVFILLMIGAALAAIIFAIAVLLHMRRYALSARPHFRRFAAISYLRGSPSHPT